MPSLLASSCSAVSAVKGFLARGFFAVFCRRRFCGLGLDSAVEDSVGAAPLAVNADRAASSDEISEFTRSMRPSIDWMSCWSEGMTADRTGGRGSLTDVVQARPVVRATIRPGWPCHPMRRAGPPSNRHERAANQPGSGGGADLGDLSRPVRCAGPHRARALRGPVRDLLGALVCGRD